MDLAFCLWPDYRRNIRDFEGRYLFRTADHSVTASAFFGDGEMHVRREEIPSWNVCITFRNASALRDFLFSRNQDILDSLLKNEVEVQGNLNYIFKFGFMARDLFHRLGVA